MKLTPLSADITTVFLLNTKEHMNFFQLQMSPIIFVEKQDGGNP